MLGSQQVMAFVATSDVERAKDFYSQKLGLKLTREEPIALVYDAGGTMLRIAIVQEVSPQKYTVLGWQVADIAATVKSLVDSGVTFERYDGFDLDDLGIWTSPDSTKVAWFKDPDDNVLSLAQFPTQFSK